MLGTFKFCAKYLHVDFFQSQLGIFESRVSYTIYKSRTADPIWLKIGREVAKNWEKHIGYFLSRSRFRIPPHWSLKVTEIPKYGSQNSVRTYSLDRDNKASSIMTSEI
ncbi:hypothetical protein J6590_104689 [Homalodisca vitripennis]|nr:hypothetical protein J6590_104689 [Homalodisca vitripennis]